MHNFLSRVWSEISLDNLEHNFKTIKAGLNDTTKMMCVVKADAYGHGVEVVVPFLEKLGTDQFAVSNIEEAVQLRNLGISKPILILGYTQPDLAHIIAKHNLTQAIIDLDYAQKLSRYANSKNVTVNAHLKIDTGMSRIGFVYHDFDYPTDKMEQTCALTNLNICGAFTHFASADFDGDETGEFTNKQFKLFCNCTETLKSKGIKLEQCHCCNSAATIKDKDKHLDAVRTGIILYGLEPSSTLKDKADIKPVMSLKAVVSMVKELTDGDTISYGRTKSVEGKMRVATIPVGYADGFFRNNHNGGYVLINGKKAPICGRVCMDQTIVDITDIDGVCPGDEVLLFGEDLSATEYASFTNTINYEAVCAVSKRVTRVYTHKGKVCDIKNNICKNLEE